MKNFGTCHVWVTSRDVSFEKGLAGGQVVGDNLCLPKHPKKLAAACEKRGTRFGAELTKEESIFIGVYPDGTSPAEALKSGQGLVWECDIHMVDETIEALQRIKALWHTNIAPSNNEP